MESKEDTSIVVAGREEKTQDRDGDSKSNDSQVLVTKGNGDNDDGGNSIERQGESKMMENPFSLPSDDQIFLIRERERKLKKEKRERLKTLSVYEKSLEHSKNRLISRRKLDEELEASTQIQKISKKRTGKLSSATSAAISSERRSGREDMSSFISKKREMFLVQMSLDTKREEIRKLEEKAQLKEEALRKSELMLEEDAIRFDTFLKENDKKAHDAIKRAEMETKMKQEKLAEIKKINHQIQTVQSDMTKLKEQLEDCLKYKAFLDELTPPEFFEEQEKLRRRKKRKARKIYKEFKIREFEDEKRRILEEYEERRQREESKAMSRGLRSRKEVSVPFPKLPDPPVFDFSDDEYESEEEEEEHEDQENGEESKQENEEKQQDASAAAAESKENDDGEREEKYENEHGELSEEIISLALGKNNPDDEEMPMYFQDPRQLLEVFTQLEESNLFLIQNSQETEQALEELKMEYLHTKQRMDLKTNSLKGNIDELRGQIDAEEDKAKMLKDRMGTNTGEDAQEKLLSELNEKVKEVYKKCGFDADASPATLSMLTDLEARLEDLLSQIEQMPEDYVVKAEKLKEKERRERVRAERLALQQQIYEERLRKSIERSMQAPKKKTGKPVMFRSAPPQKKVRKKDDSAAEEKERDMKEFFSWNQ